MAGLGWARPGGARLGRAAQSLARTAMQSVAHSQECVSEYGMARRGQAR